MITQSENVSYSFFEDFEVIDVDLDSYLGDLWGPLVDNIREEINSLN